MISLRRRKRTGCYAAPNYSKNATNKHHRRPKSLGGTASDANISIVPIILHEAYNALFGGNATPQQVASILTKVWIDPDYVMVAVPREKLGLLYITGDGQYKHSI